MFRYPGIRSDSDLHTFGFSWRPWSKSTAIADGESIRNYVRESAEQYGIDRKIQFQHKLQSADWSSDEQQWTLSVDNNGEQKTYIARFMILSTGYYDYSQPLKADIPGIDNFKGTVIHPQFWPEDLDYAGKRMVIIGSGATAITLLPNLVDKAAQVTMLQRSPSYIIALPAVDPLGNFVRKWFPTSVARTLVRWKFLVLPLIFFKFCRAFPNAARTMLSKGTQKVLPASSGIALEPNFKPKYNPWEQRLCICPDGDFFKALQRNNADIVTDTIENVTATGIKTSSGNTIETDIIITATGLKMQLAGGAAISVDGVKVNPADKFVWKSVMIQDIPNACLVIGYTNASWTLGADATALLVCRLIKHMQKNSQSSAVPRVSEKGMQRKPLLNLNSTYIEKAKGALPSAGDVAPWKARDNYMTDFWVANNGSVTKDMEFTKIPEKAKAL